MLLFKFFGVACVDFLFRGFFDGTEQFLVCILKLVFILGLAVYFVLENLPMHFNNRYSLIALRVNVCLRRVLYFLKLFFYSDTLVSIVCHM